MTLHYACWACMVTISKLIKMYLKSFPCSQVSQWQDGSWAILLWAVAILPLRADDGTCSGRDVGAACHQPATGWSAQTGIPGHQPSAHSPNPSGRRSRPLGKVLRSLVYCILGHMQDPSLPFQVHTEAKNDYAIREVWFSFMVLYCIELNLKHEAAHIFSYCM